MTRRAKRGATEPAGRHAGDLSQPERVELHRQGAKAAARGDEASSNPMNDAVNLPQATGEPQETWRQRQQAWKRGHEAQSTVPANPAGPPGARDQDDGHD
jgi:hypothetical protein